MREKLHDGRLVKLQGEISRGRVGRDLVVLDALRRADQGEVGRTRRPSSLPSLMTSSPSSTSPAMPLQGLARAGAPSISRLSFSRSTCVFGLREMGLEQALQLRRSRRLGHLRQRLHQLLLGMQDVAQLVDQQLLDRLRSRRDRNSRRGSTGASASTPASPGTPEPRRIPKARLHSTGRGCRSRRDRLRRSSR